MPYQVALRGYDMQTLTIIGRAKTDYQQIIKATAEVVDCAFKTFETALVGAPGQFTLADIDLDNGPRLARLKEWVSRKPCGAIVFFVIDKSSHLEVTQARAIVGSEVLHRPIDIKEFLGRLVSGIAALPPVQIMPLVDAPSLVPQALRRPGFDAAVDGLEKIFSSAVAGKPIDGQTIQFAAHAVVDEIERIGLASWVDTVRAHHSQTYQHCLLVTGVAVAFANHLKLSRADRERLSFAGMLHDIGKARIPINILEKPAALDLAEMREMRNHPRYGYEMLSDPLVVPPEMLDMVLHHHEYLDGSGYPDGLKAHEISDLVRMITISDIFGALIERRAYKPPFTGAAAYKILCDMGPKLDKDLVREFEFASKFDLNHFAEVQ